jgi:hypothetical protein
MGIGMQTLNLLLLTLLQNWPNPDVQNGAKKWDVERERKKKDRSIKFNKF